MAICRLLNHRFTSCIFTISILFQISACDTAQFADAVAGNLVSSDSSNSATSSLTPDEFLREPDHNATILNGADTTATNNTNDSIATTASSISRQSTTDDIMYSYFSDLSDAKPLNNAVLEQRTVYMFTNSSLYTQIRYYCCKRFDDDGNSTSEDHNKTVKIVSAPYIFTVDISQYSTTGTRELYFDATRANGSGHDSDSVYFNIQSTIANPAPAPSFSDVGLSWVAPSEREDNSGLSLSEIAGYKIYYGTSKGTYPIEVSVNDRTVVARTLNLAQGTYYFVMTTLDMDGRESKYSAELKIAI